MPWTFNNPPSVAKNWSNAQKRKCVAAANAVLRSGKSDREAIFACIHAAGKGKHKQNEDEYEQVAYESSQRFQDLVRLYFAGTITLALFRQRFEDELEQLFVKMMILGLGGKEPTETDFVRLNQLLDHRKQTYLNKFIAELSAGGVTEARGIFRAGMYGWARHVFINYTVPDFVALGMPVLPGEDCLGGDLCGCYLEIVGEDDEFVYVDWVIDPVKENCEVCLTHALEWNPIAISKP